MYRAINVTYRIDAARYPAKFMGESFYDTVILSLCFIKRYMMCDKFHKIPRATLRLCH